MSTDSATWTTEQRRPVDWLADMNEDDALPLAKRMLLEDGADPMHVLDLCRAAMDIVGKRFEQGEYFLPELVLAGEMLDTIGAMAKPLIKQAGGGALQTHGKVLIGTVHGDLHDIGKNIVTFMLDVNGFDVHDLGIDVAPETFIAKIKEVGPEVVGLSGFLTFSYDKMKETIEAIAAAGLRDKVKVMIGGGMIDEKIRAYSGADAYGRDAMAAVTLAKRWVGAN